MSLKRERKGGNRKRGRPRGLSAKWAYVIDIAVPMILKRFEPHPLTVRQIYYQLVANYAMKKDENNYDYLSKLLVTHRKLGWINWNRIVDLTRKPTQEEWITDEKITPEFWWDKYLKTFLEQCRNYHIPLYMNQEYLVEVWTEHEGLIPLFEDALKYRYITLQATRGQNSWSNFYRMFLRLKDVNRKIMILHFADYDRYGLQMTNKIQEALDEFKISAEVKRVALTFEQVKEWNIVDTQLEAIDPTQFRELISNSVDAYIDRKKYEDTWRKINNGRNQIEEWIDENDIESLFFE